MRPLIVILIALATLMAVNEASAQTDDSAPTVVPSAKNDTSAQPLSALTPAVSLGPGREKKEVKLNPHATVRLAPPPADPLLKPPEAKGPKAKQTAAGRPIVIGSFEGIGQGFKGPQGSFQVRSAPPDTNGAVGETQFVQWVNTQLAVFDKSTGAVKYGPVPGNTLWQGFGGNCEKNNDGDPVVQYDRIAKRWVLAQFSVNNGFSQCVAVSTTSDATGTYHRYEFKYPAFNDYPKMSVWPDGYYTTFNMFNGNNSIGSEVCVYDRKAMLTGASATQQCFQLGPDFFGLLPADIDGASSALTAAPGASGAAAPPAGSPNYIMALGLTPDTLSLWKFHVDWSAPKKSRLGTGSKHSPDLTIQVPAFTLACNGSGSTCVTQPGSPTVEQLDSLGERLMFRLSYRNFGVHETLLANHSVDTGPPQSRTAVRWYELRSQNGSPFSLFQAGTFAPDANHRWMGSVAMDKAGDVAAGYSASGKIRPAIRVAGRTANDPPGQLGAELTLQTGGGTQQCKVGNACVCGVGSNGKCDTLTRWGDYSSMTPDPVDDCVLWYTTEYIKNTGAYNWHTRVASLKFPNCS